MKQVVLITNYFPYKGGEQFLEAEIKSFSKEQVDLIVLPLNKSNSIRTYPKNIEVDFFLSDKTPLYKKLIYTLQSLLEKEFYEEVAKYKQKSRFLYILDSYSRFLYYKDIFEKYIRSLDNKKEIIFYTYWFTDVTISLLSLKKDYSNIKVITRAHGYDLYEDRRIHNFIPLRRTKNINNLNKIFTITESANNYLKETYNYSLEMMQTARLGVTDNNINTFISDKDSYHIVSCSYLVGVKQIYKIIEAMSFLEQEIEENIYWTHLGDGPLKESLIILSNKLLNKTKVTFLGELSNKDVFKYYKNNKVDVFINVSKSEGVPVSIMEAMSCHIPIIAPNVGGISDMVQTNYNGVLLSEEPSIDEIAKALKNISFFKNEKTKENTYKIYKKYYNAENNYKNFINTILHLEN